MSEANILNTSSASQLNPQYGWQEERLQNLAQMVAQSGKWFGRRVGPEPIRYSLHWNLDSTNKFLLQQWARQYATGFFTLVDWEATRYFSGRFAGPVRFTLVGNNNWDADAVFEELPTLALNTYPSNWSRDAIFLEEVNDFLEDLPKFTGAAWTKHSANANAHGGYHSYNTGTDTAQFAEWLYFGYGFRWWSMKDTNFGIAGVTCTRRRDNTVVLAEQTIDCYAAAPAAAAALLTKADLPLDEYIVKVRATNTKNAASTAFIVAADAIEIMQ